MSIIQIDYFNKCWINAFGWSFEITVVSNLPLIGNHIRIANDKKQFHTPVERPPRMSPNIANNMKRQSTTEHSKHNKIDIGRSVKPIDHVRCGAQIHFTQNANDTITTSYCIHYTEPIQFNPIRIAQTHVAVLLCAYLLYMRNTPIKLRTGFEYRVLLPPHPHSGRCT